MSSDKTAKNLLLGMNCTKCINGVVIKAEEGFKVRCNPIGNTVVDMDVDDICDDFRFFKGFKS